MPPRRRVRAQGKREKTLPAGPVNLKQLAEYLGLAPATVSLVMNRSPVADSIPAATQERIRAAARKLNYRPHYFARSLRQQRTLTVGVLVPEISAGYNAMVMSGIEDYLLQAGYLYFVASHRHRADLIEEYPRLLLGRAVEGLILVDTPCQHPFGVPIVTVSGHHRVRGVTNIVLDHQQGARLAVEHLCELGHRRIAFIKGQAFSSDTEVRFRCIQREMARLGLEIEPSLVVQLEGDCPTSDLGYSVTKHLLGKDARFTALFAFNDISAIGAMRALQEKGRRVPEEVAVVGFDDIPSAAFQNPALTTVRQPLRRMGELAAEILLERIAKPKARYPRSVTVKPELVVRASTGPVRASEPAAAKVAAAAATV